MPKIFKNKIALILILMILVLMPKAFGQGSQAQQNALVTAVGIDYVENKLELSIQIVVPMLNGSTNQLMQVVTANGEDVSICLNKLAKRLGKQIGLAHCNIIILGGTTNQYDIKNALDYFYRYRVLGSSALIISTNESSRDLLIANTHINKEYAYSLNDIIKNNKNYLAGATITLEEFYRNLLSFNRANVLNYVVLSNQEDEGIGSSSTTSTSQNSSSESSSNSGEGENSTKQNESYKDFISNNGECAIYKDGKFVRLITAEQSRALAWWVTYQNGQGAFQIDNINDEHVTNSNLGIIVKNKTTQVNSYIEDGAAVFKAKTKIKVTTHEILNNYESLEEFRGSQNYISQAVKEKIKAFVIKEAYEALEIMKQDKTDILEIFDEFNKHNYHKMQKFIEIYGDDYLNHIEFILDVEVDAYE